MTPRDENSPYQTRVEGKILNIYPGDHPPPHAHVFVNKESGGTLVFNLKTLILLEKYRHNRTAMRDVAAIRNAMKPIQGELLLAWLRLNPTIH